MVQKKKMNEELYEIYDERNNLIGSHLTRANALLLIDAMFSKYYNDIELKLTINKMVFGEMEVRANEYSN